MKMSNVVGKLAARALLLAACGVVLILVLAAARPPAARADEIKPPPVPDNLQVPEGNKAYLVGHAAGTQNYICLPFGGSVRYTLFTPQATLFDAEGNQIITHYFSPNPAENGTIRATWLHSKDTSTVWGQAKPGHSSTDPAYVEPGAIAWLLVTVVGSQNGPEGGDRLASTTFIQRVNTSGGVAPSTGCSTSEHIGNTAFVPYTTDYIFYRSAGN